MTVLVVEAMDPPGGVFWNAGCRVQRQVGSADRAHQHPPAVAPVNLNDVEALPGHCSQCGGDRLLGVPTPAHRVVRLHHAL